MCMAVWSVTESTDVHAALVTGASGFIGRHLCEALQKSGVRVRALLRKPMIGPWDEYRLGDLTKPLPGDLLVGLDTVYHLAGKAHALAERQADWSTYADVNVEGTRRLLTAVSDTGVKKFVFFSSVKTMGEGTAQPQNELSVLAPKHPYGETKREAEDLVRAAAKSLRGVILRLPMVYGMQAKGNLQRMLRAVDLGRFPPIMDCGNRRSMVHVDDVVAAAVLVSESPQAAGKTYIITDGNAYSSRKIYELMCQALGRKIPGWSLPVPWLSFLARFGDAGGALLGKRLPFDSDALEKLIGSALYDSKLIETELGFRPTHDLAGSLGEMVKELRSDYAPR